MICRAETTTMTRKWLFLAAAALALNVTLVLATGVFARGTAAVADFVFGPKVVRAEVVVYDNSGLHDYRVDRGRIRSIAGRTLTISERDGSTVTVSVAPEARIQGAAGRTIPFERLRPGWLTETVAETTTSGVQPATLVRVLTR
jgi:hypothetical protein